MFFENARDAQDFLEAVKKKKIKLNAPDIHPQYEEEEQKTQGRKMSAHRSLRQNQKQSQTNNELLR